jgi:hypothetical protein
VQQEAQREQRAPVRRVYVEHGLVQARGLGQIVELFLVDERRFDERRDGLGRVPLLGQAAAALGEGLGVLHDSAARARVFSHAARSLCGGRVLTERLQVVAELQQTRGK